MNPSREPLFLRGIELFNRREFYACHEVLEDIWRPSTGPNRLFLQSIIHLAVGLYHHERGNPEGARRQLDKGLRKLAGYLPFYLGIDTSVLYTEGIACLRGVDSGGAVNGFSPVRLRG